MLKVNNISVPGTLQRTKKPTSKFLRLVLMTQIFLFLYRERGKIE